VKAAVLLVLFSWCAGAARRPFAPEDLRAWRTASDARIRPDGRWVVYVESYYDGAVSGSNLWIASTDGKERKRWTEGAWNDSSPRWSPDGERIAWISDRGGTPQIRMRKLDSTADIAIASQAPVLNFAWSADGEAIAFTARVAPKAVAPPWLPPAVLPRLQQPEGTAQIFVVAGAGGAARQLSHAETGCRSEPSWTLDAKSVIAPCDDGLVSLRASVGGAKILSKDAGLYESPLVSPDGGRVAYLFTERKPQSYTVRKLWVMNVDGSRARALTGSLDRDAADPQWSSESRTVYFLADDRGATRVYAARNDGTVRQATDKPERLRGFSLADNGRAASVRSSATEGGDVVTFTVDVVSQPVTLSAPNEHLLADREIGPVEEMAYQSDGRSIQAWLVKPAGFDAGRKYPLLVDVADDPRRMYGVEFQLRAQILAARGFVVLLANPRGTPGYGEEFGHLLRTRYPGDDFDDLMRGVDTAIAKGSIDPQRVAIAGGLVAAWAIGHTPRFYRAVARRPVVDWAMDIERAAAAMGGMPWDDPEQYVKHSPIYFAQNFKTPTLILAGEADAQSEQLYRALEARRVEAALVRSGGDEAAELEAILGWLLK
jgi:dipeptidyl aminopeptidase/acylaminoacyl peptidase